MSTINQILTFYRGEQVSVQVPFVDENGDPITLTSGRFTVAPHPTARRLEYSWLTGTTELSLVSIAGTDDGLQLTLTPQQTRGFLAGRHTWFARGKPSTGSQIGATGPLVVLETADALEPALT